MVALRGKKAKATTAKPKPAAAAAKSTAATAPHAQLSVAQQQQQQEQTQQRQEQEFLQLLRFIVHSTLVLRKLPQDTSIDAFCSTMLTALCSSSKERHATPAQILSKLTLTERKRVCGAIFSADEIAYSCRNCQIDSTCVTCRDCFTHRYALVHSAFARHLGWIESLTFCDRSAATILATMCTFSERQQEAHATAVTLRCVVSVSGGLLRSIFAQTSHLRRIFCANMYI